MPKEWDSLEKLLAEASPQHLVSFVLPGAKYLEETFTNLPAQSREIQADVMYNVQWEGVEIILHIEFQRRHDEDMGRRVWEYNALASIIKQLPVFSFVIYLVKDHGIVRPPYREIVHGKHIRDFYYTNIYLWELEQKALKQPGLEGVWPLLPLTKDGARLDVVEDVITGLQEAHREDLLSLVFSFAALIFTKEGDRQWLQRRLDMLHDILEESWVYQEIKQKGLFEGRKEARQRELQLERQTLTIYVEGRFPALVTLLKAQMFGIEEPELLRNLLIKLFSVQNEEEARGAILALSSEKGDEG